MLRQDGYISMALLARTSTLTLRQLQEKKSLTSPFILIRYSQLGSSPDEFGFPLR